LVFCFLIKDELITRCEMDERGRRLGGESIGEENQR
jgi:hypothetical protein